LEKSSSCRGDKSFWISYKTSLKYYTIIGGAKKIKFDRKQIIKSITTEIRDRLKEIVNKNIKKRMIL